MFVIWWWALLDKALWEHIGIKYQWCLQFIFQHFTSLLHHSVYFTQLLLHFTLSIRFTSHLTSCDLTSPDSSCHTSPYSISSLHTSLCTFKTSLHTLLHFTPHTSPHSIPSLHSSVVIPYYFTSHLLHFTPYVTSHLTSLHTHTSLHTLRHFTPQFRFLFQPTSVSFILQFSTSLHSSLYFFSNICFNLLHFTFLTFPSITSHHITSLYNLVLTKVIDDWAPLASGRNWLNSCSKSSWFLNSLATCLYTWNDNNLNVYEWYSTISHPEALPWRVKSSGVRQSKITKGAGRGAVLRGRSLL